MPRLEKAAAWAGIIAGVIAFISLFLQILRPDNVIVQEIEHQFPFHTFFLFILAIVAMIYFLVRRMVDRIGDMNVTLEGDVITTNRIGDYLQQNIDGMSGEEVSKIIEVVTRSGGKLAGQFVDTLNRQGRRHLTQELARRDPEAIRETAKVLELDSI